MNNIITVNGNRLFFIHRIIVSSILFLIMNSILLVLMIRKRIINEVDTLIIMNLVLSSLILLSLIKIVMILKNTNSFNSQIEVQWFKFIMPTIEFTKIKK